MSINKITDCHPGLYDKVVEYDSNHNSLVYSFWFQLPYHKGQDGNQ